MACESSTRALERSCHPFKYFEPSKTSRTWSDILMDVVSLQVPCRTWEYNYGLKFGEFDVSKQVKEVSFDDDEHIIVRNFMSPRRLSQTM
ncbi:hypothetical protein RvY_17763 [Ramazzottius varieornatus]|uniref:Uncharacterized protein n=1 Tax=Ramazzottius varieornatus TaxID=947166 RepID=A0A1D1W3A1_RAMVA|nr:hypothetical protein RvY_17763 [Ramazzottius varieornatus]